jgi:hypothetical protein
MTRPVRIVVGFASPTRHSWWADSFAKPRKAKPQ